VKICRSGLSEPSGCDEEYSDDGFADLLMAGRSILDFDHRFKLVAGFKTSGKQPTVTSYAEKDAPPFSFAFSGLTSLLSAAQRVSHNFITWYISKRILWIYPNL